METHVTMRMQLAKGYENIKDYALHSASKRGQLSSWSLRVESEPYKSIAS